MAIVVTALGTAQLIGAGWATLSGLTWASGDVIIAVHAEDASGGARFSNNGIDFVSGTIDAEANNTGNVRAGITRWHTTATASGTGAVQLGSADEAKALTVYKVTGLDADPLDKTSSGIGTNAPYNTGSSGVLSQVDELCLATIGIEEEEDQTGAWTTGAGYVSGNEQLAFADGGGTKSITVCSAAKIVSATTAQEGDMEAPVRTPDWAACIATYKAETGGVAYHHGLTVQGEGELALCDVGTHPLRIRKGGTTYGIELVATDDPNASRVRVKTGAGIKAIRKYT